MKARLAMTVGDPRGIGPEIVAKALADPQVGERCDIVVVGPEGAGVKVGEPVGRWLPKSDAALAGRLSGLAIERAVAMALDGAVDGIVTATEAGEYDPAEIREQIRAQLSEERSIRQLLDELRRHTYVSIRM